MIVFAHYALPAAGFSHPSARIVALGKEVFSRLKNSGVLFVDEISGLGFAEGFFEVFLLDAFASVVA